MIDYRILGPLEVSADGRPVEIGGPKLRALLVILLLRANEAVPRDVLVHELWGERPPDGAQHTLDVYVSRLRKALEAAANGPVVLTRPGAYSLRLEDGHLDAGRFEHLVQEGKSALAGNAPDQAAATFRAALKLWRGQALADLANGSGPPVEAARLEEMRLGAVEDRVEADLALGRHEEVVGELQALAASYPLRERLYGQLMTALYRCGRQAEALEAYQTARRTLVQEFGLEPSPALQRLEGAILRQDASLDRPGGATAARESAPVTQKRNPWVIGSHRTRWLLAIAGALAVTLTSLAAATTHESPPLRAGPNTIGVIDGISGNLSAVVAGVGRPSGVAYGAGAVWITDSADDLLIEADQAGQIVDRIQVGHGPAGVTVGGGQVWVANGLDGTVSEVNPGAEQQVATIPVGIGPDAVAFGYGSVWVTNVTDDTVSRIDAANGKVTATIPVAGAPNGIAVGDGSVWLISQDTGELQSIDPVDDRPSRAVTIADSPDGLAAGAGAVWIAGTGGTVSRFDPQTGKVHTIRVDGAPTGVVYSGGAVWVANSLSGTVSKINPETGATQLVQVGNEPTDLAATGNNVWATVLPSLASHRGGTLTIIGQELPLNHPFFPTDSAIADDTLPWQMLSLTNDGLVGYQRVGGLAGDELVPDLATALPVPTDGGLTYSFRLRAGLAYSTGVPVRPEDFRRALERVFVIGKNLRNW
jgi:YVTN family beta-propeller protein